VSYREAVRAQTTYARRILAGSWCAPRTPPFQTTSVSVNRIKPSSRRFHIDRVTDHRSAGQATVTMRVALYSSAFPPLVGGTERFTSVLADFLARDGHQVTVVTLVPLTRDEELRFPYPVIRNPSSFRWVQIAHESDVVHVNLTTKLVLAACAGLRRPIQTHHAPHAICPADWAFGDGGDCTASSDRPGPCQNCPERSFGGCVRMACRRACVHLSKSNVSVSQYLSRRLGLPRSVTIYNPVDPRAFLCGDLGSGEDGLIAFAGRLADLKGLDLLIRALPLVPEARLEVIGDPPEFWPKWKELADQCGVGRRVDYLGSKGLNEVLELYARAAVVCVPTRSEEPFGYAAAEAMAAGRAVVATPRGALPELLEDDRGWVSNSIDPSDLAVALRRALEDPQRKSAMEERARGFAESHFHPEVVGRRYVELYNQCAS
jgi:glycogen synthase